MKFCQTHWDALRAAITERGLFGLVAKSGEEIVRKQIAEIESGETSKTTFDPLMGAQNTIVSRALFLVGIDILLPNEDGTERCPICHLQAAHDAACEDASCTASYDTWIGYAADKMRDEAVHLGLMATA